MQKNPSTTVAQPPYEPRWFIWTIMFLLVTGVALVSYIQLYSPGVSADPIVTHVNIKRVPVK